MPSRSEAVLRVVYALLGVDALLKSILLVFGGKWVLLLAFPGIPNSEISKLLLLTRQEYGALEFGVAVILFLSVRNPRNTLPVLYGIAAALFLGAVVPLLGAYRLGLTALFSGYAVWLHSALRIAVAGLLLYLRPTEASNRSTRIVTS